MTWRALPLAALIGCTVAAPQLAAEDCVLRGAAYAEAPIDIREGVVSWAYGTPEVPGQRTILDCSSGKAVQLNVTRNTGPLGTRDVTQEVSAWLYSVPEPARLSQLRKGLVAMGVGVSDTLITSETCPCAALYPELRDDKAPYEART